MDLKKLREPLPIGSIDFRVQSINKGGYATILAYKDARVDINRLNEVCGVLGWKREHTRDNKNCTVSIWDKENKHWVSKEDTGKESKAEAQKGLASDSFKRACFNLGLGIELYDYPIISIKLKKGVEWDLINGNPKSLFGLKIKDWVWSSEFKNGVLIELKCVDENNNTRFCFNKKEVKTIKQQNNELILLEKTLKKCKTYKELGDVYTALSPEERILVNDLKERLKIELNGK